MPNQLTFSVAQERSVPIAAWDANLLAYVRMVNPTGGGGGGGAATIADGADVAEGATTDVAIVTDTNGTLSGKLRGLVKILADVWDSVNHRLKVDGSGVTQPVSGTFFQATQPVSLATAPTTPVTGTFFQATQPVSVTVLPLPTGASTEGTQLLQSTAAKQDTGNASVASIDIKTPALGQTLSASSVPVVLTVAQISTLTPPAAITGFALEAGHLAAIDTVTAAIKTDVDKIPSQGQALMVASTPVVVASNQSTIPTQEQPDGQLNQTLLLLLVEMRQFRQAFQDWSRVGEPRFDPVNQPYIPLH